MSKNTLPLVPLRGLIVFPNMSINFDVGRARSLAAVKLAMNSGKTIILSSQIDATIEDPSEKDIYKIGTVAKIKQFGKLGGSVSRVSVEGLYRVRISEYTKETSCFMAIYEELEEEKNRDKNQDMQALMRANTELFKELSTISKKPNPEATLKMMQESSRITSYNVCYTKLLRIFAVSSRRSLMSVICMDFCLSSS